MLGQCPLFVEKPKLLPEKGGVFSTQAQKKSWLQNVHWRTPPKKSMDGERVTYKNFSFRKKYRKNHAHVLEVSRAVPCPTLPSFATTTLHQHHDSFGSPQEGKGWVGRPK